MKNKKNIALWAALLTSLILALSGCATTDTGVRDPAPVSWHE